MTKEHFLKTIASGSYSDLLEIYNKYKINKAFDAFFSQPQNPSPGTMHHKMLLQRVKDIYRKLLQSNGFSLIESKPVFNKPEKASTQNKPIQQPVPKIEVKQLNFKAQAKERVQIKKNPSFYYDKLPDDMKVLYDQAGKLSSEMKSLHAEMRVLPGTADNDVRRKELVNEIAAKEEQMDKNWQIIDDWYNMPGNVEIEDIFTISKFDLKDGDLSLIPPAKFSVMIESCKSYLRKNKDSKVPKIVQKKEYYKTFLKRANVKY